MRGKGRGVKIALAALVFLLLAFWLAEPRVPPLHIDGAAEPKYQRVLDAFKQNFLDGWEHGGASFAVFVEGRKVVDVWGGYADAAKGEQWTENTISLAFSATKAIAAVAVAIVVDRGWASYDDLVVKHWPEFGQHGKDNVTVQMLMSHMAGLPFVDGVITVDEAEAPDKIGKRLAEQKPAWPPGTATGYHIYTYGWLADQLIRRVDPKRRSIGQFVRDEIAWPLSADFHIGLPPEHAARVARLIPLTPLRWLAEVAHDYRIAWNLRNFYKMLGNLFVVRALCNVPWLDTVFSFTFNNAAFHSLEVAAALGIGNARSLAAIFSAMGERELISEKTLAQLSVPVVNTTDQLLFNVVSDVSLARSGGLVFLPLGRAGADFSIGHPGYGCQQVELDVRNRIAIAYTTSSMKAGMLMDMCRTYDRIRRTLYDVVEEGVT